MLRDSVCCTLRVFFLPFFETKIRIFLRITDYGDQGATWTVQTLQHNKQQDSSSCGILVLRVNMFVLIVQPFISNLLINLLLPSKMQFCSLQMIISGTETSVMSRHLHGLFIRHGVMLLLHCFSVKVSGIKHCTRAVPSKQFCSQNPYKFPHLR